VTVPVATGLAHMREDPAYKKFARELRGYSLEQNERDWSSIKSTLDRMAGYLMRTRPALYFAAYGVKEPSYVDLLFHDGIAKNSVLGPAYGVRRPLALCGIHALQTGKDREAGRAILLLAYHSTLRRSRQARESAKAPRARRRKKPSHAAVIQYAKNLLEAGKDRRNVASATARFFLIKQKQPITDRAIRSILKKSGI